MNVNFPQHVGQTKMQPLKGNGRDMNILFLRERMHVKIK